MNHYIDLRIRLDPEFPAPQLMNALFAKLHRALVVLNANDIGVSFPHHDSKTPHLGDLLRLHGAQERLQQLMETTWLTGMSDHVDRAKVLVVPNVTLYRTVRRVQAKSSMERIRRRQMKRHGLTVDEARIRIPDTLEQRLDLPWVQLRSISTQQNFRLYIEHLPCQSTPQPGIFSRYGLSRTATIPWF